MNIEQRIIEIRRIALKAETRALSVNEVMASIDFAKIGKKLDAVLRFIKLEE